MNRLATIIGQAVGAIRAFKLRTLFCLVSIALGVSSITIIVAATEGAYQKAFQMVARFGPDALLIASGSDEARAIGQRQKTVTMADVAAIRASFPQAYLVAPMTAVGDVTVSFKGRKEQTRVFGSTDDYSRAWSWPVVQGSDLIEADVKGLRNVGLIGSYLGQVLFGEEDPVGKYILVKSLPVQIVGVLSSRGMTPTGFNLDDRLVMPISTVMRKLQNESTYVSSVRMRFADSSHLKRYEEEVKAFLRLRHGLNRGQPDDFRIVSPTEIVKFLVSLTGSLVTFLGVAGITSLVVAGFVLANLFLLSVKERGKEIGIRRSVGARRRDILFQFLGEAVLITTAGGVAGFILGVSSSHLLTLVAEFPIHFSWKAFATGMALSWAVGLGFGIQPASRAANLNPIDAIRE